MASGKNIKTYFNGEWKDENTATIKAAIMEHGLGPVCLMGQDILMV